MAQTGYTPIQLYYSATASAAPSSGNLAAGELAINTNDGKLYYKDSGGSVQLMASKAGASGDVVGPASATDNSLVAFDGTTGKLVKQAATVTAAQGGTGQSSYTVGDLVYASGATTLAKLADVATGNALISGGVGVAPSYGKIGLTTHVSGTLPVANGGTGASSLTANNVLLGNGTSAVQVVAPGTTGNFLRSNGSTWISTAVTFLEGQTDSSTPFETSLGYQAGNSNSGGSNTLIGYQAGVINSTGAVNTFVGALTGSSNTTGSRNTAIGGSAYFSGQTGNDNTAVGEASMSAMTSGANNVAVGAGTMLTCSTGSFNTCVGAGSLPLATGSDSTAVGYASLGKVSSGTRNVGVGSLAGTRITTGGSNTVLGAEAGSFINSGGSNVVIGSSAAATGTNNLTSGSSNVFIGTSVAASGATVSSELVVGSSLTGKGTQTAFIGGTNGAYNAKNVTTWETTSDQRIKKNIVPFNQGLEVLNQIQVKNFEYRTKEEITELDPLVAVERSGVQIGIIAQELRQVLPQCVTENSTGVLSVNTDSLVWYLINAVKQLSAEVEQLKQK